MLRWGQIDTGIRLSHGSTSLSISVPDWRDGTIEHRLPRRTAAVTGGSATELQVPTTAVRLVRADGTPISVASGASLGSDTYYLTFAVSDSPHAVLTDGAGAAHLTHAETAVFEATIAFTGPATVRPLGDELGIRFDQRTAVTIGVPHEQTIPEQSITVTPTPEGIATALTQLARSNRTAGPEYSHPTVRHHPPLVEIGDEIDVPVALHADPKTAEIELRLPARTESLYVAAPLAYYLGASVTVEDRSAPLLVAPDDGFEHAFSPLPAFQNEVASVLRRTFFVDCLLRTDPYECPSRQDELLTEWGLSQESLRDARPAERLAATLTIPVGEIEPHLPEWYLATYVDPEPVHVQSLPFLLDNMSLIYLPEASSFDGKELIRRSLDDFYRAGPQAASVDVLMPNLQSGYLHGWLAEGTPIDVFKATHAAYENRLKYGAPARDALNVDVVLNDDEMDAEHEEVAAIYRERSADLPINLTVHKSLKRKALAEVFESRTDLVHYIGHCDIDGLRCPNGNLAIEDIGEVKARSFFLNACGSYHEGNSLIKKGSVAGAVTLTKVLNDQAATVGSAFARLLINGYDFERAMQLARRRIMMGKDYAVVGDGTYTLSASCEATPAVAWVEKRGDRFDLTYEAHAAWANGDTFSDPLNSADTNLYGAKTSYSLSRDELCSFLQANAVPVIFDGDFSWSTDLWEKL